MYKVVGISLKDGSLKEFNVGPQKSLLKLQDLLYDKGYELDEQTTLEKYLDHAWLDEHILEIVNDYAIMSSPLCKLLNGYGIYDMVK